MIATMPTSNQTLHPWRPIFWEPVSGTGERLMVGVLHQFNGQTQTARIIRDDVLDSLYGQHHSTAARKLIDTGLHMLQTAASVAGMEATNMPLMGLAPGELRATAAQNAGELLRTAALLYSSLAGLDRLDELEEADAPMAEEGNRRFSTEVRELTLAKRPELAEGFGRSGVLIEGGQSVRFGYFSPSLVAHFSVLHPVRQSASVRDARARLWELARAMTVAGLRQAALITAVPRQDDATLGEKQRANARANEQEIEREADASHIRLYPVHTAQEAADRMVQLA